MSHAKDLETSIDQVEELSEKLSERSLEIAKQKEANSKLLERSGNVTVNNKLVSFLYELMRDHLTPGVVEDIIIHCDDVDVVYSNGWLAKYAEDVANRLR